jgi:hypothetical protein
MKTCTPRQSCRNLPAAKPLPLSKSLLALRRDIEASHRQAMARLAFLLARAADAERLADNGRD